MIHKKITDTLAWLLRGRHRILGLRETAVKGYKMSLYYRIYRKYVKNINVF